MIHDLALIPIAGGLGSKQDSPAVTILAGIALLAAALPELLFRRKLLEFIYRATRLRMYDPTTGQGKRTYWLSFVILPTIAAVAGVVLN